MGLNNDREVGSPWLNGGRVLVVEDDFFIGLELAAILSDAGAEVAGPYPTVETALAAAEDETLQAAVLDIRLGNEMVGPVARRLADHHVPFVFYTGQLNTDSLRAEWPNSRFLSKPALPRSIVNAVADLLEPQASSSVAR